MTQLRNLFVELPRACGVPASLAVIEGDANGQRFDLERRDKNSVFRQLPGQTTIERMKPSWVAWEDFADPEAVAFGKKLVCYAADCYGFNKAGIEHPRNLVERRYELEAEEVKHPHIMALYTVADATTESNWA